MAIVTAYAAYETNFQGGEILPRNLLITVVASSQEEAMKKLQEYAASLTDDYLTRRLTEHVISFRLVTCVL